MEERSPQRSHTEMKRYHTDQDVLLDGARTTQSEIQAPKLPLRGCHKCAELFQPNEIGENRCAECLAVVH